MKYFLTVSLFIVTSFSFSQIDFLDCDFKKRKKRKAVFEKHTFKNKKYHTEVFLTYYFKDTLMILNDDKVSGITTKTLFWEKGRKKSISDYRKDKLHGTKKIFYWDGGIRIEEEYKMGQKEGYTKSYYPTGIIKSKAIFSSDKKNGNFTFYNYEDSIVTNSVYNNDILNGVSYKRTLDGVILDSSFYKDGLIEGVSKEFYMSGELKIKFNYKNGLKNGPQIYFSKNGIKEKIEYRENGKLISTKQLKESDTDSFGKNLYMNILEKQPEFPGGIEKLFEYLSENIHYPMRAKACNIKGKVYMQFVVEKDGSLSSISILRGIGGGCDEIAIEAIEKMPKWTPGIQKGKPVRVKFALPVNFTLR